MNPLFRLTNYFAGMRVGELFYKRGSNRCENNSFMIFFLGIILIDVMVLSCFIPDNNGWFNTGVWMLFSLSFVYVFACSGKIENVLVVYSLTIRSLFGLGYKFRVVFNTSISN